MKPWFVRMLLLVGYSVPSVFLAMYADVTHDTVIGYGAMIGLLGLLCLVAARTRNLPILITGNLLSFAVSWCCILCLRTERWIWYFKPFTAMQLAILLSVLLFVIQLLMLRIARKNRKRKGLHPPVSD